MLAAARRLFVADGYPGTSIARIAAEAGVSGRTVFVAFASKAGLLEGVRRSCRAPRGRPVG